jgi:ATP-dependent DNA helicase RecQ
MAAPRRPDGEKPSDKKSTAKKKGPSEKKEQAAKKQEAKKRADDPFPLQSTVVHKEWGPGLVMRQEDDVITVLFEQEGYKTLSRSAVVKHELLKPA